MSLGTFGASLLGNLLAGKGIVRVGSENKKGKGIVRTGYGKKWDFLCQFFPLKIFEIEMYCQNEPRFNGVFSRYKLPRKKKNGTYVINLDEYPDVGTRWIILFCFRNEIVYLDSFGVEHVPKEIKKLVGNKNIKANIFRVQASNSVMCGYFCIGLIDFMLEGKKLTDFKNMFFPHDFEKNVHIILSYFKDE